MIRVCRSQSDLIKTCRKPLFRKPVLLIGASGMLGQAWFRSLTERTVPFWAPSRSSFDITSRDSVCEIVSERFSLVVNCSGYTDVDTAEVDEESAWRVNAAGVGRLSERCAELGVPLIHHSTDYVFDGRSNEPYHVRTVRRPINAYGRSKAAGEEMLENSGCRYLLLRTSWLYAAWGKNFVRTMGSLLASRDEVRVVDDQRGCPTSAEHLASVGWRLAELECTGTFHVTDAEDCTWYELACFLRDQLHADCRVVPCTSEEFNRPAARPAYSVLDSSDTDAVVGRARSWRHNVAQTLHVAFPTVLQPSSLLAS